MTSSSVNPVNPVNPVEPVDAITLTVIWNSLISIAEELGITLRNTAFSEGVREGDDLATALSTRTVC